MTKKVDTKRFILLGDTGAGKSSFINLLYNNYYGTKDPEKIFCKKPKVKLAIPCSNWLNFLDEDYKGNHSEQDIDDSTRSKTRQCISYTFCENSNTFELIDTPGFDDTNGADIDEQHLQLIEEKLREVKSINGIIIVINGAIPRLGLSFKNFMHFLHQVWPNQLFDNCIAVLTNCDELSVNLDPSVLQKDLNVDPNRTFYLQNSLFRWNPQHLSPKTPARFRQDFEENLHTINRLISKLLQFDNKSTEIFNTSANKILIIEKLIVRVIQSMTNLLEAFRRQQITEDGIYGAQHTMQNNREWYRYRDITVVGWNEIQQSQIRLQTHENSKSLNRSVTGHRPNSAMLLTKQNKSTDHNRIQCQDDIHICTNNQQPYNQQPGETQRNRTNDTHQNVQHIKSSKQPTGHLTQSPYNTQSKVVCNAKNSECHGHHPYKDYAKHQNQCSYHGSHDRYSTESHLCDNMDAQQMSAYQRQDMKIQITLPDNEARSHYDYAKHQDIQLRKRRENLIRDQRELSKNMESYLNELKSKVRELHSINKNYNIVARVETLLAEFKRQIELFEKDQDMVEISTEMKQYYKDTETILSKSLQS